jgi:restriction system protein
MNQAWRFLKELATGDFVVTYEPSERRYHIGTIAGPATHQPDTIEELQLRRPVNWATALSRDDLSQNTRNSLGAIQTLIKVPDEAAAELQGRGNSSSNAAPSRSSELEPAVQDDFEDPYAELFEQSVQRVQDRILALSWSDLQDLVAALLRALGYRTIVSPAGSDRGRDIVASKDGFGFERPRIVVEVKHRRNERMGAPEIRSFIGGRHADDRGLYVSTGGFSHEARYEAERAATVTHLMDLEGLARAILEQYDAFDEHGRALLPLRRLYWPTDKG